MDKDETTPKGGTREENKENKEKNEETHRTKEKIGMSVCQSPKKFTYYESGPKRFPAGPNRIEYVLIEP